MPPRLVELVDGVLFESFSVRWVDTGYAPWPRMCWSPTRGWPSSCWSSTLISMRSTTPRAKGYAFAARRARQFSLHSFVSDRALSRV